MKSEGVKDVVSWMKAEKHHSSIATDRDGDITCWKLSPTFSSYNQPGGRQLQHVAVHVYNT